MQRQQMNSKIKQGFQAEWREFSIRKNAVTSQFWRITAAALMILLPSTAAWAAVAVTGVQVPENVGLQMPFQAEFFVNRTGSSDHTFTVSLPSQSEVAAGGLPAGCTQSGALLSCTISAAGASMLALQLVSTEIGGFNITARGTDGIPISQSLTIQRSGDLTVGKSKISPTGDVIAGEAMEFLLSPKIQPGVSGAAGSDVPAGTSIVVTDTLPPGFSDATPTFAGRTPTCAQSGQVLTCTYSGPFTVAQFNASTITVKGKQGAGNGGFTNAASIALGSGAYMERDNTNNTSRVDYPVTPGSDIEALGNFPAGPHAVGDASDKTLTITYKNNGPMPSVGGTVQTVIPSTFDFIPATDLPPGKNCTAVENSSLTVPAGGTSYSGWVVTCPVAGTVAVAGSQDFPITVRLPAAPLSGSFPVLVTPPAGLADANPGNNHIPLPFQVLPPFSNLALTKSKSPGSGPQKPGTVITNTLTITNSANSSSPLTYSSANPLRVVDYLVPQEVDTAYGSGGVGAVTAGWQCDVRLNVAVPTGIHASRTTRISCYTTNTAATTLAKGANTVLKFSTRIAGMAANADPVTLANQACTGKAALDALSLPQTAGPLPVSNADETRAATCKTAGGSLVATPAGAADETALVTLVKQSSLTGDLLVPTDWFNEVSAAPTLQEGANKLYWRIQISTPSLAEKPGQQTIRTLKLADTLPGILNSQLGNTTPAIPITVWRGTAGTPLTLVPAGSRSNNCPGTIDAGNKGGDICTFKNVAPGETIEVLLDVSRPLGAGAAQGDGTYRLTNSATLSSPDAILQGTLTDAAAVDLEPRLDIELTSKTIDVPEPAIGQPITFSLAARNLGPFPVPTGALVIEDTFYTGEATLSQPAYEILDVSNVSSVAGTMTCSQAVTGNSTRITCTNSGAEVPSGNTETINIKARLKKPALDPVAHPKNHVLYRDVSNTATVSLGANLCEYRTNDSARNSTACRDEKSRSNNSDDVTFNVTVPKIDLEQDKQRVDASGNPVDPGVKHKPGERARYRFTVKNFGPSRAESVEMTDFLVPLPADFDFSLATVKQVSGEPASCSQSGGANGNIVCHFGTAGKAGSIFEPGDESVFILDLTVLDKRSVSNTGTVDFGNRAYVCADESVTYETAGVCSSDPTLAGNNLESVRHLITPVADLGVSKRTITSGQVDVGQPVQYGIIVDNKGANATNRIRLVDILPAGFEWLNGTTHQPTASVSVAGAVLASPLSVSGTVPAAGAGNVCYISKGPAQVTTRSQQQEITCDLQGGFPVVDGVVTVSLWAQPKLGVYDGTAPALFNDARTNTVTVKPGVDADGNPSALDENPTNDTATSTVEVKAAASIAGRVFLDKGDDGDQNLPVDTAIPGVTITLTGTDINGNAISLTQVTDSAGDYQFIGLPPSDSTGYTITQTQPSAYQGNGLPQANTARTQRNAVSSGVSNKGVASNTATTSLITGVVLGNSAVGVQFDFPEFDARSLSGHVYVDMNNNQQRTPGTDRDIAAAVVELLVLSSGAYVPVVENGVAVTATTGADGAYVFNGLSPSRTYAVREVLPAAPTGSTYLNQPAAINPGLINGFACVSTVCVARTGHDGDASTTDRIEGISLAAGNGTQFNFGEVLATTISGTVYLDRNDDGDQQAGTEPGIAGVTITIEGAGPDGVFGTSDDTIATVTTDADGNYSYGDAVVGQNYRITETQPNGLANGQENRGNVITISNLPSTGSTENNFGELAGSIAGRVWLDANNNGVVDPGENGIAGVTVNLPANTLDALGNVIAAITTDSNGDYRFGDLLAGSYSVTEQLAQPVVTVGGTAVTTLNGITKPGEVASTITGTATALTTAPSAVTGIVLGGGQHSVQNNFGEILPVSVSGKVFFDTDNNGTQNQTGDTGIGGVDIVLSGSNDLGPITPITVQTQADGSFSFGDLRPGTYTLTEPTQPAGTLNGITTAGSAGGNATAVGTTPSAISSFTLTTPGSSSTDNWFAEIPTNSSIAGQVWLDVDDNGVVGGGESGIAGIVIELAGTDIGGNPVTRTTTTDAAGRYAFTELAPGTYNVTEPTQPTGTRNGQTVAGSTGGTATGVATAPSAISAIALGANQDSLNNNFGEVPTNSSISGRVWLDVNNNGVIDASENGLAGVSVRLTGTDAAGNPVDVMATTDASGRYMFVDLSPGTYTVTEPTQPTGTFNGQTVAGSTGGTASPVSTLPSEIAGIVLGINQHSVDNNFGEISGGSISGKVFNDHNDNGVVEGDEPGIPNVEVVLSGTDDQGNPVNVTTTTDAQGNYRFEDLRPGTYTVTEPTQPTDTLNGQTVPGTSGGTPTDKGTTPSSISSIVLTPGASSEQNNFGEITGGSISGKVYTDHNDNGVVGGDEPGIPNVEVVLSGTDDQGNPVNVTTTTDAQGNYRFDDLRPGTYTVTEPTQPANTINGQTTSGTIDGVSTGTPTDKGTTPSSISSIVLPPGASSIDNNFGEMGNSPDVLVSKNSDRVKFTTNNAASYSITVRNGGQKPTVGEYVVNDRLPAGITLAELPSGAGWTCSGSAGDSRFTCRSSEVIEAGASAASAIVVKVNVGAKAAEEGTVSNFVMVEGGGEFESRTPTPTEREAFERGTGLPACEAGVTQNVCGASNVVQLAASVGGTVWFDIGSSDAELDGGDKRLPAWIVELLDPETGAVERTMVTGNNGEYRFDDVVPGVKWNIQFRDPTSGVVWAWPVNKEVEGGLKVACDADAAIANSDFSACRITENGASQLQVVLKPGAHLPQQSLPVDPSGVVYDVTTRDPVPGSIVTMTPAGMCNGYDPLLAVLNASSGGYRIEGSAISMTVGTDGYYQFVFGPGAPARCEFRLDVTPPGGYQFVSTAIPPEQGPFEAPGPVGSEYKIQPQSTAPTAPSGEGTRYWLDVISGSNTAGIIHNHIPLDAVEAAGLVITKTGDRQVAEIGDTVQYTISVRQTVGQALATVNVVDTLPRGFTYIEGTSRVDGRALADPAGAPGPRLGFNLGSINVSEPRVLTYRVRVGVGAQQGDGINRAQAHGCSIDDGCMDPVSLTPVAGSMPSNHAQYRVRVTGGVFTEEACVLGKVFVDCNNNHVQDREELGIPGVRLYFSNGTWMISDSEGKYSYCGLPPQSHTLKVDASTLPVGARLTTSSNRNLGDADSLFLDLKNGELHRADFVEGSCANPLLEQVKARRTQGEVSAPETETAQPSLRFESKSFRAPQQATDSANQRPIVQPRSHPSSDDASQEVQP
jgi:uncharacterized repeat protein (TIGR01451 family)